MGLWGFPDSIVEAIAFHHCPSQCPADAVEVLTAVHVANALDHDTALPGDEENTPVPGLDYEYLERLGLVEEIPAWRDIIGTDEQEGASHGG